MPPSPVPLSCRTRPHPPLEPCLRVLPSPLPPAPLPRHLHNHPVPPLSTSFCRLPAAPQPGGRPSQKHCQRPGLGLLILLPTLLLSLCCLSLASPPRLPHLPAHLPRLPACPSLTSLPTSPSPLCPPPSPPCPPLPHLPAHLPHLPARSHPSTLGTGLDLFSPHRLLWEALAASVCPGLQTGPSSELWTLIAASPRGVRDRLQPHFCLSSTQSAPPHPPHPSCSDRKSGHLDSSLSITPHPTSPPSARPAPSSSPTFPLCRGTRSHLLTHSQHLPLPLFPLISGRSQGDPLNADVRSCHFSAKRLMASRLAQTNSRAMMMTKLPCFPFVPSAWSSRPRGHPQSQRSVLTPRPCTCCCSARTLPCDPSLLPGPPSLVRLFPQLHHHPSSNGHALPWPVALLVEHHPCTERSLV